MVKTFTDNQIKDFWQNHDRFLHANLVTEAPNPISFNLSDLCINDINEAFNVFQKIELSAINSMVNYIDKITELRHDIKNCLDSGNKIFLIGCGASGRLAMLLKRIYELQYGCKKKQIVCVSSAGDTSLIKAVEQFEDNGEFGIKQLLLQGFTSNDLAIGLSASGESPFILSAINYAANCKGASWLLFNNPVPSIFERNPNHIIKNPKIHYIALDVGPMALTGSTRLQATTAMQIAIGLCLFVTDTNLIDQLNQISEIIKSVPLYTLSNITIREAEIIKNNQFILYKTGDPLIGLSLLADITERAPTFNLPPFENITTLSVKSPFYFCLQNSNNVDDVWEKLFGQAPTCLEWKDFPATSRKYINGFDLSEMSQRCMGKNLPSKQYDAVWQPTNHTLNVELDSFCTKFTLPKTIFQKSLVYKLLLNSHSTIMLGRNGYFSGNMMLSLKPSNYKLIDRAIRYSQFILKNRHGINIEYKKLAPIVFEEIEKLEPNQSIVTEVVDSVCEKHK